MPMYLADATSAITTSDFSSVLTTLQDQISVSTIVSVIALGAGVAVGFAFMWWGVRKLVSILMTAFKKGKVKL